jgi:hypothetical protein
MAIGYANFGTIQQGNQQVVNSMVGLGQSISSAINTHAATESAKAMLPMLQQQYQSGMQKIASGDPNGIGDIYGAALTASQNPLLAPMAKNAITTAQSANINAQHMLRTQAYINARSQPKVLSTLDDARLGKMGRDAQINQINSYNSLYSGTKDSEGIGALAEKIRTAVDGGKTPEEADVRAFASKVSAYRQAQGAYGNQAIQSPEIEAAYQEVQGQIPALQGLMKAEEAKGSGITGTLFGLNTDPKKVGKMKASVEQLQGIGGMPSAKGAKGGGVDHASLYKQAEDAIKRGKDPTAVMKRMKELGFDPNAYRSQMQGAIQGAPQASIDESEAVAGEEETSPEEESLIS